MKRASSRATAVAAALFACAAVVTPVMTQPMAPRPGPGGGMADVKTRLMERLLNKPAPPFRLKDIGGKEVSLADFKGRVVLLNFWFSACGPCRQETPDLITLYRLHRDAGLIVIGLNTDALMMPDAGGEPMRRFLETYKIPYPVLIADHAMYRAYGSSPVQPISFLIDRKGTVAQVFWGARPGAVFDRAVRPLLAAGPSAPAPPAQRRSGGAP